MWFIVLLLYMLKMKTLKDLFRVDGCRNGIKIFVVRWLGCAHLATCRR